MFSSSFYEDDSVGAVETGREETEGKMGEVSKLMIESVQVRLVEKCRKTEAL